MVPMCDLVGSVLLDNNLCCGKWIGWKLAEIVEEAWPVRELGKDANLGYLSGLDAVWSWETGIPSV